MNNYTLFKAIRAKTIAIHALHAEHEFWTSKGEVGYFAFTEKLARTTVHESETRNIYTLTFRNHPTIESITAKACKFPEDKDFTYTVSIRYHNGNEKLWGKDGIREWVKAQSLIRYTDFAGRFLTTL